MTIGVMLIPLIVLAVGVTLLAKGLRGRRVDDHPICRACGFDLFGRPLTSSQCAECGADLTRPHAIVDGRRVRRSSMVVVGSLLLGIFAVNTIFATWVLVSSAKWREYAPVWYLRHEARGGDPSARDAALTELTSRLSAGVLSQAQVDALTDQALAIQADANKPWAPTWGDLVETAAAANKLSAARFKKYLEQALVLRLEVRPRIARGERLYYWIRNGNCRVGSRPGLYVNFTATTIDVGLMKKQSGMGMGTQMSSTGSGATGTSIDFTPLEVAQIAEGPNTIVLHLDVKFARNWTAAPVHTMKLDLKGTFLVLPAGESSVTVNRDPSLRAAIERGLTCKEVNYGDPWAAKQLRGQIAVGVTPVGVGFDVYARVDGKDQKVGSFARAANPNPNSPHGFGFGKDLPGFEGDSVDLILKPSVDAAIGSTDTFEIWDGEIVLKNVPVKRPAAPATTKAAPRLSK